MNVSKVVNLVIFQDFMEKITASELSDILRQFPVDTKIVDMFFSEQRRVIRLESNSFKKTSEAEMIPEIFVRLNYGFGDQGNPIEYFAIDMDDYLNVLESVVVNIKSTDSSFTVATKTFEAIEHQDFPLSKYDDSHIYTTASAWIWGKSPSYVGYDFGREINIEKMVQESIVYGSASKIIDHNDLLVSQTQNPVYLTEEQLAEFNAAVNAVQNIPFEKKTGRECCGVEPKWVDNGIGFQYHLCKTCGKEVE